ncbi:MAG: nucleotide sugar dehydrogenase [Endomicrobiales bacterium]
MIELSKKIDTQTARIGIVGLGYVGLPLAIEFAKIGCSVTGFEIDAAKVKSILKGTSYISDVSSAVVKVLCERKTLTATADFSKLSRMEVIIICVPTPLRKSKDPDVSYIISAAKKVAAHLRKGQLVILESTTYPGTTRELVLPMLEESGLKCGKDFYLAFSPERVDPGNQRYSIHNTTKVVGGITAQCSELSAALYKKITTVLIVSSTETAEMVKLLENTFRAVNIALINEVALMCDKLKLDVWEIIDAAATKPFGYIPFYPGPGIGGHCIPLDPHYLSWKLKTLNFYSRFIELAGELNSKMPEYLVNKVIDALNARGKSIIKSKVLILGVAYKKDVGDVRESPAIDVIKLLLEKKGTIDYFDPLVKSVNLGDHVMKSLADLKTIGRYDAVVIVTNHTGMDYKLIVQHSRLIIDSRNATKGIVSDKIIKL